MSRAWYRVETGNPKTKDAIAKFLRRRRYIYEVEDMKLHYDWWKIKVCIRDKDELEDVNRFLATI